MNQSEMEELKWTVESQRTDIEGLNGEIVNIKQKLENTLAESVQGIERRIAVNEEYVTRLRSETTQQADAMNESEMKELKWTVESQRTDIEGLSGEIVSIKQKLKDTLAESVQGLEKRIAENEDHVAEIRSKMTPKADTMNESEIEGLKLTVESQRTDIEGLNGEIVGLKKEMGRKGSQIDHEGSKLFLRKHGYIRPRIRWKNI